jgi:hypothetical protein
MNALRLSHLLPLTFVDGVLVAMHLLHVLDGVGDERWRLNLHLGYGEWWQYVKAAVVAGTLAAAYRLCRAPIYLAWAAAYCFVLLDDALEIHERGGRLFASLLHLQAGFGLRAVDVGELLTWSIFGTALLAFASWAYRRSNGTARFRSIRLAYCFGLLAFFGGFIDMASVVLSQTVFQFRGTGLLEDGGEMLVLSLTCAYTINLMKRIAGSAVSMSGVHPNE